MDKSTFLTTLERVYQSIEKQIPHYMQFEEDRSIAEGNVAVCLIDESGQVYGKMFGQDAVKNRAFFRIAWIKASQVWITKQPTGKFEELVFAGKLDDRQFGIERPDFIGWEGGQPISLGNVPLAVGFSGFRGVNDLEIVAKAFKEAMQGR
jgi:glc operon protein GlcG